MEKSIFDTGFLFGFFDDKDKHHADCKRIMSFELPNALLPDVVLPELAYLILRELEVSVLTDFLRSVTNGDFTLPKVI